MSPNFRKPRLFVPFAMPNNLAWERCEMVHKSCERRHMSDAAAVRSEVCQRVRDVVSLADGNRKAAIAFASKVLNLPFDRVRRMYYGQARMIHAHEADQIRAYVQAAQELIEARAAYESQRKAFLSAHPALARVAPGPVPRTQAIEEAEQAVAAVGGRGSL